jgi:hypothetical protein
VKIELDDISRKTVGLVEQIVCASGRQFVGTKMSTFSAYIYRLRGYLGATDSSRPPSRTRYLTEPQLPPTSKELEAEAGKASGAQRKQYLAETTGNDYMKEYRTMWRDI